MGFLDNLFDGRDIALANSANHGALKDAKPLFLIGPPRSGTTMLTRVLNSHPRILLTNETAVLLQLAENVKKSRIGRKAGIIYGKNSGDHWANILTETTHGLVAEFYARLAAEQDKDELVFWGEKHPHFSRCMDFLEQQFSDATYVYAIRDPRDSICSIAEMTGNGIVKGINVWKKNSDIYEDFVSRSPPSRKIVTVKYEDFIADYDKQAESMFLKLDVRYADESRQYIKEYSNVDAHTSSSFVFKGPAKFKKATHSHDYLSKSVGRWKQDLDTAKQKQTKELFQVFLSKYGYLEN